MNKFKSIDFNIIHQIIEVLVGQDHIHVWFRVQRTLRKKHGDYPEAEKEFKSILAILREKEKDSSPNHLQLLSERYLKALDDFEQKFSVVSDSSAGELHQCKVARNQVAAGQPAEGRENIEDLSDIQTVFNGTKTELNKLRGNVVRCLLATAALNLLFTKR